MSCGFSRPSNTNSVVPVKTMGAYSSAPGNSLRSCVESTCGSKRSTRHEATTRSAVAVLRGDNDEGCVVGERGGDVRDNVGEQVMGNEWCTHRT